MDSEQIQRQLNSSSYFSLVSFSILFYDYFLVLDFEISRYWDSHFSWVNVLFFVNRYGALLGNIPVVMEYFWTERSSPAKIKSWLEHTVMLILRTYALYERSKRVLTAMMTVAAAAIAVALWSVVSGKAIHESTNLPLYFGCNYPTPPDQGINLAAAWAGVAVFDSMIFILTLYKAFSRRYPGGDLLAVLLRDVLSNLSNILTFVLGTPYTRGIATTFTNIISSVMITRLMLNLRDPGLAHMSGRLTQGTILQTRSIRFAPWRGTTALDTDNICLSGRNEAAGGPFDIMQ
ncbi:hypothetical protein C8R47DRAFT_1267232 [Mycena vitilis]|nr:hypothetical protein C8R47DRAFT_1267232 [Mycena vitilis]